MAITTTRPRGAQPGNTNRGAPVATTHLHMRCSGAHKGAWTRAANLAVKQKRIVADGRGNLASWVVTTLNAAAAVQLKKGTLEEIKHALDVLAGLV